MKILFTLLILLITSVLFAQKHESFIGRLEYKITIRDTNMRAYYPENRMIVYTNDTITRIENFTDHLGKQVVIHHMELNKSYTLIDSPKGRFAIKHDYNKDNADTITKKKYELEKKCGKEVVLEKKAKKLLVHHPTFEEGEIFLYYKAYSNKYLKNFEESPGLLARYSVIFPEGQLDYELIEMKEYLPEKDLFGIPSDYQKVSIDEFIKIVTNQEAPKEQGN